MARTDPGLSAPTVFTFGPLPHLPRTLAAPVSIAGLVHVAIGLFLIANIGRFPLLAVGTKDTPLLVTDVGIMAVLAGGSWVALRYGTLRLDRIGLTALLFAAVGALSAVLAVPRFGLSGFQLAISLAYLARWLVYFGLYLMVINFVRRDEVGSLWRSLERMVIAFGAFGIFQSAFLPGFAQRVDPGSELYYDWDPQGHRLVSTFLDPNFAGGLLMIVLLVMLAWLAVGERVAPWKLLLLTTALVLTVSRSSVIGLLAGAIVVVAVRGVSRRLVRAAGVGLLLLVPLLPLILRFAAEYGKLSVSGSALARLVMWARALEIFADNPVLGIGFNTYGFVQSAYGYQAIGRASFTLDGGLLFVAVMTGVVGLSIFCWMLGLLVLRCRRTWRDPRRDAFERGLALGTCAATVALVVHSIFLNSLFFPFLMGPMWVLWGLVYLVHRGRPEDPVRTSPPRLVTLSTGR